MMTTRHMTARSPLPWWAAFGAPLFVVPLLIALLAVARPAPVGPATSETFGAADTGVEVVEPAAAPLPEAPRAAGGASC